MCNIYVISQQALTLEPATNKAFLPLDLQICDSDSKVHSLTKLFRDGLGDGAKRYQQTISQSKVGIAADFMRRVYRASIKADYVATGDWLGTKELAPAALSLEMAVML